MTKQLKNEINEFLNSDLFINDTINHLISEYEFAKTHGYDGYDGEYGFVKINNINVGIGDVSSYYGDSIYFDYKYLDDFIDMAIEKCKEIAKNYEPKIIETLKKNTIKAKIEEIEQDFKV